ncbi:MAG: phosphoenolpyruvate carboxylase, partial [Proteobacteria bacterium]|nr:phosphoenolpyruvate carboxylase [Pseudomonadota bacterium]
SEDGRFFWSTDPEFSRLLQGASIPRPQDQGGDFYPPNSTEDIEIRNRLVDGFKRFVVIENEIGKHGEVIADRHQIAEFSKPAHFYMMMKFFEEANLIEIERKHGQDPVVAKSKMMIQPLIETMEDFENAPKIFAELLKDPLIVSYYKAMGSKAHIMLGFSDGAKTSGCFASEWKIYRTMQTLNRMFAESGIDLETTFSGRGRREARGGEENFSEIYQLLPREINQKAVFDVTTQSDQPVHMATSAHYGEVKIAQAISGTIQGAIRDSGELTDTEQKRLESYEKAMDTIANKSAEIYQKLVRDHPQSIPFIKSMIRNPFATSRPTIRLEELPKEDRNPFDGLRMITVEYAGTLAKMPFLDAGMKEALQFAIEGGIEVLAKDGETVLKGREALDELYANFNPAKKLIDKASTRMRHFDPVLAKMWTDALGTSDFGKGVIESLTGLDDLVKDIGGKKETVRPRVKSEEPRPHVRGTQAIISTCLISCDLGTDPKSNASTIAKRPDKDPVLGRVNLNAYSVMANQYGRPAPLTMERIQAVGTGR